MDAEIYTLSETLGQYLKKQELYLATAESCTGGGLAYAITDVPGSSLWFDRGFITYSNLSKQSILNVPDSVLKKYGAVSLQTATLMAEGALQNSIADVALSITGIAGPSGDTPGKPVGTVCFGFTQKSQSSQSTQQHFNGSREHIRKKSIHFCLHWAMQMLLSYCK
jgi:nicotinamide-nucleotide amidase